MESAFDNKCTPATRASSVKEIAMYNIIVYEILDMQSYDSCCVVFLFCR
jgi:hypothetical protein